jgi:Ca2+-binding RTX toxin-like protein
MAIFHGTASNDRMSFNWLSAGVTTDPTGLPGTTEGDDLIFGFGGNDTLDGSEGYDTIYGGDGDDVLDDGSGGGATIYGEAGNDNLGDYFGTVYIHGGTGSDRIWGGYTEDSTLIGGHGNDWVATDNGNNSTLIGGGGTDYLDGGQGGNLLRGGAGNDTLNGGDLYHARKDVLIGGTGDDTFVFDDNVYNSSAAPDVIRGEYGPNGAPAFEGAGVAGGDIIDLSDMDANGATAEDDPFVLGGTGRGHLVLSENGTSTIIKASTWNDFLNFKLIINDGDIRADDYIADDFIL